MKPPRRPRLRPLPSRNGIFVVSSYVLVTELERAFTAGARGSATQASEPQRARSVGVSGAAIGGQLASEFRRRPLPGLGGGSPRAAAAGLPQPAGAARLGRALLGGTLAPTGRRARRPLRPRRRARLDGP